MPPTLIVCPSCACHAKSTETRCPTCDQPLRREDGSVSRAAVAVLLGLTAASVAVGACGSTTTGGGGGAGGSTNATTNSSTTSSSGSVVFYGPAQTSGSTSSSSSSGGGGSDAG